MRIVQWSLLPMFVCVCVCVCVCVYVRRIDARSLGVRCVVCAVARGAVSGLVTPCVRAFAAVKGRGCV